MARESISRTARFGVRRNGTRLLRRARRLPAASALAIGARRHGQPRPAEDGETKPGAPGEQPK
jgi:hypothetical protein